MLQKRIDVIYATISEQSFNCLHTNLLTTLYALMGTFLIHCLAHLCLSLLCTFYPGTMTTHTESINSDLKREMDRRLRHTQH